MSIKTCKKCGGTEYYAKGGCATCMRARAAWYRRVYAEEQKAKVAAWRALNKEKTKEANAAYKAAHKERLAERGVKYRQENYEADKERLANWRKANPDYWRSHVSNRRARKLKNGGVLSKDITQNLLKLQKGRCAVCKTDITKDRHLDHVVPLARGGTNDDLNVQLLCPSCNYSKHAKDPIQFMQSRGFLL